MLFFNFLNAMNTACVPEYCIWFFANQCMINVLDPKSLKNEVSFLVPKYFFAHVGKSGMPATKRHTYQRFTILRKTFTKIYLHKLNEQRIGSYRLKSAYYAKKEIILLYQISESYKNQFRKLHS